MPARKGHKKSPEEVQKILKTRAANKAKMGPQSDRRKEEPALPQHAGDADYNMASSGRVLPHFDRFGRGWDD